MFTRFDHVAFAVRDPGKSAEFYIRHFGFRMLHEEEIPLPFFQNAIYIKLNDIVLELFHFKPELPDQVFHFCLYTDDFDRDYDRLKNEGVHIDMEPRPMEVREPGEKNWKRATLIGPDGELIEMCG